MIQRFSPFTLQTQPMNIKHNEYKQDICLKDDAENDDDL